MTERLQPDDAGIAAAVEILDRGGLVGIPTETVYGLAADAESAAAVAGIFEAKGRPSNQPLIVHALPEWAPQYAGRWSQTAELLAARFWPGPLTLVVGRNDLIPAEVTGGLDSVGLRCPSHPIARQVLEQFGKGLAAPSANRYGHVSPTTAQHVLDDLDGRIDAVLDAGRCDVGLESTIVALDGDGSIQLLRSGAITTDQIAEASGTAVLDRTSGAVRAPGMVKSHYAPRAPVSVLTASELRERGRLEPSVLVVAPSPVDHARSVVLPDDTAFAAGLYAALRLGDAPGVSAILVVPPPQGPLSAPILDRLRRAAHRNTPDEGQTPVR